MNYFCRQCHKPLINGQQMCSCGQIFNNPVPDRDDQVEVVYWEPPKSGSAESRVQLIQRIWENINPAAKAGGFGTLAVLLIIAVIAGNHHPNPAANSRSTTPPMVRPVVPVQSQVPPQASSASSPLVLSAPKEPVRKTTTGTDTGMHNLNPPILDRSGANGSGANPAGGQQAEVPQPQQVDVDQQVRELDQRGMEATSDVEPNMMIDVEREQQDINTVQSCIAQLKQIDPDGRHGSLADVFENDLPDMQDRLQNLKKLHEEQKEFGGMNN